MFSVHTSITNHSEFSTELFQYYEICGKLTASMGRNDSDSDKTVTALSSSFETNCKLQTGRKFSTLASRPGFFIRGRTTADFHIDGKWPVFNERLTNLVMNGNRISKHSVSYCIGIGSTIQVVILEPDTSS